MREFREGIGAAPRRAKARRIAAGLAALAGAGAAAAALADATVASASSRHGHVVMASRDQLTTIFSGATVGATLPDDITASGGRLFVAFQNGVGPQGQPSTTGVKDSTVVEITPTGVLEHEWSILGKIDGMTADPTSGEVVATVDEDANSAMAVINPANGSVTRYSYAVDPLPHNGGTDAISFWHGGMLVGASAPGTLGGKTAAAPNGSYPAVYRVTLDAATHVAQLSPVFFDEDTATLANAGSGSGSSVALALTDPDSSGVVPASEEPSRFAGAFALDSQGDKEMIFLNGSLSVLKLAQSIDDFAWPTAATGAMYITDSTDNIVDVLRGPFTPGTTFVEATPCDASNAPATCPAPGYAAPYLGTLSLQTGAISRLDVGGLQVQPSGLAFVGG